MTAEELVEEARAAGDCIISDFMLKALTEDPEWSKASRIGDWRYYVPEIVQKRWGSFSLEAKAAIYVMAENRADSVDWDID